MASLIAGRSVLGALLLVACCCAAGCSTGERRTVGVMGVGVESDAKRLTLNVASCSGDPTATVTEMSGEVRVLVEASIPRQDREARMDAVRVTLDAPLGNRVLIDESTGRGVPTSNETGEQSSPTTPSTSAVAETAVDGPVMRYPNPSDDRYGMGAGVRGVLQLEGMCLYVAFDEIGERYPVLWPAGTRWDDQNESVIPPAGPGMPIGSEVYGGGGYLYVNDIERLAGPEASALASTCVDNKYGEIAVVNNQDTAIGLADG